MTTRNDLPHQALSTAVDVGYPNVRALFEAKLGLDPDKTFLTCPGRNEESFTYRDFHASYELAARYLTGLGLAKGDRINIVFGNSSEFLILYFAGLALGITVVPINPDLAPQEMSYIISDSRSSAVFYQETLVQKLESARAEVAPGVRFVGIGSFGESEAIQAHRTDAIEVPYPQIGLADEAIIIYTSGTSGKPKGVVLSNLNLLGDAKAISEWFQFSRDTRTLCILPLFHNNGQITTFLAPLYAGGSTVVVKGKASLMAFWGLVQQHGVSWTSIMPSILSILLNIRVERTDDTMRGILCGGQVLAASVQEQFEERFNVPIFEGYGLTETTSFSCINDFPQNKRKPGSIGRPLLVNEMAVLDEAGRPLGPGEEGEICIRGLNVACEYLGLPERNATAFAGGWFHSGDQGSMDADGYFYFRGRKDFLIIKGGENIYPAELENVFFKHPAVGECAVIGIPDKLLGEELCAFVKLRGGAAVTAEELQAFCKGKIAAYKQAKQLIIVDHLPDLDELPKGPTKKVLYRVLKEYYESHATEFGLRVPDR
jgi:acyl-CoA synthetase (AMP-forming)/AMP-acid ligase II